MYNLERSKMEQSIQYRQRYSDELSTMGWTIWEFDL